jgi:sortase A
MGRRHAVDRRSAGRSLVGYLVTFSGVQELRAQNHLTAALKGTAGLPALTGVVPSNGEPVAILMIPALGLRDVVIAGTSAGDLEEGPAYLLGSAPPGTHGNTVIAGRRLTFGGPFSRIGSLHPGDQIKIVSSLGSFTYVVEQVGDAVAGETDPVGPIDTPQLTLVTAASSIAPNGLEYVVAKLAGKPVAFVERQAIVPPQGNFGLVGDPRAWLGVVLWSLLLAAAAVLTALAFRRTGRRATVYVLSTPVLLALCLCLYQSVAGLLPSTL